MTRQLFKLTCYLGLGGAITFSGCFISVFSGNYALAQIAPDTTLGAERSIVTPLDPQGLPVDRIDGGAIRGTNLFHSFLEFNVAANRGAYFFSPANIQNILARVTGSNASQILGTLGTFGASNPNLFLINPNGIIFGENASLDVGGSFVATTANAIQFGNQGFFSASNPEAPALLTVNPSAFFFNQINAGRIENRSIAPAGLDLTGAPLFGLRVPEGRSFLLVGGDIALDRGRVNALGGRVELAGVAGSGTVGLNIDGNNLSVSVPDTIARANVSLTNRAQLYVLADNGGSIAINAFDMTMAGESGLFAGIDLALGSSSAIAGNIEINATGAINLTGRSRIYNLVLPGARGQGGDINITANQLLVSDVQVGAVTLGADKGGNLTVNAADSVQVIGNGGLFTQTYSGGGDAGNLTITTGRLLISDGAGVDTGTFGAGRGGNLTIYASDSVQVIGTSDDGRNYSNLSANTKGRGDGGNLTIFTGQLLISNGAEVSTGTDNEGNAGSLTINASESVQVIGTSDNGQLQSGLSANTLGRGNGGELTISTGQFLISDGAVVSASTIGEGKGGSLTINASDSVQVIGISNDRKIASGLFAATLGTKDAGELIITTGRLLIAGGGQVSTSTYYGSGNGGSLTVNAFDSVEVIGTSDNGTPSGLFAANGYGSTGNAGNLTISTGQLLVSDGAAVSARTEGVGKGGSLTINAFDSVQVIGTSTDDQSILSASTEGRGDAGELTVNTRQLLVSDGAVVTTSTSGAGNGGSLTVNASDAVQVIGTSDDGQTPSGLLAATTESSSGNGGNIRITTGQLLISNGAQVSTSTQGEGKGGKLTVDASDAVQVIGTSDDGQRFSSLLAATTGEGNAGELTITTGQLLISEGAQAGTGTFGTGNGGSLTVNASDSVQVIGTSDDGQTPSSLFALTDGSGNAGELTITTGQLLVSKGAQVSASTDGAGAGGSLTVNASDSVQVIGTSAQGEFSSGLFSQTKGEGDARELTITTGQLLVSDGAVVSTSTQGAGAGGRLTVNASDSVQVIGTSDNGQTPSGLFAQTIGEGNAGELLITTEQLLVSGGAVVSARTEGTGKGGSLTINASDSVQLSGADSGLFVNATAGSTAGDLTVETRQISVSDGAQVTVSSPTGQAGNMTIKANSLRLNQGRLFAETAKSGTEGGANITLIGLDLLRMDNESLISTNALEDANGGNITIDSTFIVATPPTGSKGSDITANAVRGNGGRVNITTQGLLGIEFRPQLTPKNDITVSSEFGLIGDFQLNSPDVDPSRGLAQLPTNVVDASDQIDRRCTPAASTQERNSFTITGRGGLPPSPNDPLQNESIITNWVSLDSDVETKTAPVPITPKSSTPKPLVEAQGWMLNHKGEVVLTASALTATHQGEWFPESECDEPSVQR